MVGNEILPMRLGRASRRGTAGAFDLSLVIPAYNEAERLPLALDRLSTWMAWAPFRVEPIVVDDGSSDATAAAAVAHRSGCGVIRLRRNSGKGAAVRVGVLHGRGRVVAFTDADLPYRMEAVERAFALIDEGAADMVVGARDLEQSAMQVHRPWQRTIASSLFRAITHMLVSREVHDTQCGLKVFSRQAAADVFPRVHTNGFAFDAEAILVARRLGLVAARVPVVLVHEAGSTVSLRRHGPQMLRDIVRSRRRHARGVGPASAEIPDYDVLRTVAGDTGRLREAA